jgi:hypothetical protein
LFLLICCSFSWSGIHSHLKSRDPGFFRDFQVEGLDPGFLYAIHKHQAKILRFFIGHIFYYGFCPVSIIHSRFWIFVRMNPTFWLAWCYPPRAFAVGLQAKSPPIPTGSLRIILDSTAKETQGLDWGLKKSIAGEISRGKTHL